MPASSAHSERECTLAGPATLEGTSLHTGQKVTLSIKPAPEGHGFKFRRIDLPDKPLIDADVDKVVEKIVHSVKKELDGDLRN